MRLAAAWLSAIFASAIASPLSRRQAGLAQCLQAAGVPISPSLSPFNSRLSYEPAATVTPQTVQQVSDAVKCGAASDVSVVALSGGHSYTALGLGGQDGSLVLVMSLLDEVTLDGTIATVGAGTKLGNMAQQLFDLGERGAPHGVCPYVGCVFPRRYLVRADCK